MIRPILIAFATTGLLAGCALTREAQEKPVDVAGTRLALGGTYKQLGTSLTLTVNGEAVMTGRFAPYTPTLRMKGRYQGMDLAADCYFASALNSSLGAVEGVVAAAVQAGLGKGADKCDMRVAGKLVETLYF